jgi:hypothetical protein
MKIARSGGYGKGRKWGIFRGGGWRRGRWVEMALWTEWAKIGYNCYHYLFL